MPQKNFYKFSKFNKKATLRIRLKNIRDIILWTLFGYEKKVSHHSFGFITKPAMLIAIFKIYCTSKFPSLVLHGKHSFQRKGSPLKDNSPQHCGNSLLHQKSGQEHPSEISLWNQQKNQQTMYWVHMKNKF